MEYISTRDGSVKVESAKAISQGISSGGGLFVPVTLPTLSLDDLNRLKNSSYNQRAIEILSSFLTDFTVDEIKNCVNAAYNRESFPPKEVTPIVKISEKSYALELWHGPTSAFKDMALQLLPHLMTASLKKIGDTNETVILVATSGDTGKAALEGFKDVKNTRIIVFYPNGGVSPIQYRQMSTQEGDNVSVYGVRGNFDDTQTSVKKIFTDSEILKEMKASGKEFSSANSINWGRLVPQIVYYISAYCDMLKKGEISLGEKINVCVPTGNFGNILAAYYAKNMGLPINKLICASNINNVLTDFIKTGIYDRRREFRLTSSPSMDILISSNLERLLFEIFDKDSEAVLDLMNKLSNDGVYQITGKTKERLQSDFYGGFCSEEETAQVIRDTFTQNGYLCDTHTAVAIGVYEKYLIETLDNTKTVIVSTANPYKFADSMLEALDSTGEKLEDFQQLYRLKELTNTEIPHNILELENKPERFSKICDREEMADVVREELGLI